MPTLLFDDDTNPLDDAELETLAEYLEARMSYRDEQAFENRLVTDRAFRARVRPIVRQYFAQELSPIAIEIGKQLAARGIIRAPKIDPPETDNDAPEPRVERRGRRASRRRPLNRQRRQEQ